MTDDPPVQLPDSGSPWGARYPAHTMSFLLWRMGVPRILRNLS